MTDSETNTPNVTLDTPSAAPITSTSTPTSTDTAAASPSAPSPAAVSTKTDESDTPHQPSVETSNILPQPDIPASSATVEIAATPSSTTKLSSPSPEASKSTLDPASASQPPSQPQPLPSHSQPSDGSTLAQPTVDDTSKATSTSNANDNSTTSSTTPAAPTSAGPPAPVAPSTSTTTITSAPAPAPKAKAKIRGRRAPRRRRAAGESDSEDDGHHSDDSLTSVSDSAGSDDEDNSDADADAVEDAIDGTAKPAAKAGILADDKATPSTAFPNAASTTPAAWADEDGGAGAEEISYKDFNDPASSTRTGQKPNGTEDEKAGAAIAKPAGKNGEKVYTAEQTRKFEERKAKMKERQKAKRNEIKNAKRRAREESAAAQANGEAPTQPPQPQSQIKGKGKQTADAAANADEDLAAATANLAIDDPNASSRGVELLPFTSNDAGKGTRGGRRGSSRLDNREAYAQRMANDPKFTPRVGNFWTHDQRHYDAGSVGDGGYSGLRQMGDYWQGDGPGRGRGRGAFRGGFRGRGRGFGPGPAGGFGRDGEAAQSRGRELAPDAVQEKKKGGGGELEMDKLWAELEAKERAREERKAREALDEEEDEPEITLQNVTPEAGVTEGSGVTVAVVTGEGQKDVVEGQAGPDGAVAEAKSPSSPVKAKVRAKPKEQKWGHEGFESLSVADQFSAMGNGGRGMGMSRGHGRGRGRGFPVIGPARGMGAFRGRVAPGPAGRIPFNQAPVAPRAPLQNQASTAANGTSRPPTSSVPATGTGTGTGSVTSGNAPKASKTEDNITQTGTDDLLAPPTQAVTVRLPGGGAEQVIVSLPSGSGTVPTSASAAASASASGSTSRPSLDTRPPSVPLLNGAGEFVPSASLRPTPKPVSELSSSSAQPSPRQNVLPVFATATGPGGPGGPPGGAGSDHGSISSSGYFAQNVTVGPNGEYYVSTTGTPPIPLDFQPQAQLPPAAQQQHGQRHPSPFYPSNPHARSYQIQHPQHPSQQFYPQSFSPDGFIPAPAHSPSSLINGTATLPHAQAQAQGRHSHHPSHVSHVSHQSLHSSQFPSPDGRGSPFSPYAANGGNGMSQSNGFFAPARSNSKISIRAPSANANLSTSDAVTDDTTSDPSASARTKARAYAQAQAQAPAQQQEQQYAAVATGATATASTGGAYNPYAQMNGSGLYNTSAGSAPTGEMMMVPPNGINGMGMPTMNGMAGMMNGQEGMYYPHAHAHPHAHAGVQPQWAGGGGGHGYGSVPPQGEYDYAEYGY